MVIASSLASVMRRMKFLVAVRPGLVSPTVSARMAVSLDRISDGRCLINVVTGGDPAELAGEGQHHDSRYEITHEFLTIWEPLLEGKEVDFEGRHLKVTKRPLAHRSRTLAERSSLFRRIVRCGNRGGGQTRRSLLDAGRATRAGDGENRASTQARRRAGPHRQVSHAAAYHR